jgi:hypothetical protein
MKLSWKLLRLLTHDTNSCDVQFDSFACQVIAKFVVPSLFVGWPNVFAFYMSSLTDICTRNYSQLNANLTSGHT